ncbi:MAG: fibronectin type III domain-containing protein [Eubacterium sp.]|nr:fibronectin type III domain-containing protein [Eubacterium sp.]
MIVIKSISNKRLIIFLLTAVIILTAAAVLLPSVLAAESKITGITVTLADNRLDSTDKMSVHILKDGKEQSVDYYNVCDYDNITLTIKYADGSSRKLTGEQIPRYEAQTGTLLKASDDQLTSAWGYGSHKVTYTLAGFSATATYTVIPNPVTSVTVTPIGAVKPIYHFSGEYDTTSDKSGAVSRYFRYALEDYDYNITLKYQTGTTVTCPLSELYRKTGLTAEFSHAEKELAAGKQTGYCTVNGATGSFSFEIVKNDIKSVSLYFEGGTPTLSYPNDGAFQTNDSGKRYFKFYYDRSAIRAKVTYTNGSTKDMSLGALAYATHGELILEDDQDINPWQKGTVKINGSINGVTTSLSINVAVGAPTLSKLTATSRTAGSITVKWGQDTTVSGYQVQIYRGGKWVSNTLSGYAKTSYTFKTGLSAGTKYSIRVRPYTIENGTTVYGEYMSGTFTTAPAAVSGFKLTGRTSDALTVGWAKSANVSGYQVQIYRGGKWYANNLSGGSTTSYIYKSGLTPGTRYDVRIRPYITENGENVYGAYVTTYYYTLPAKVSGLKLTSRGSSSLTVGWNKNTSADGFQVQIYRGGKWVSNSAVKGSATSYTFKTGLSPATKYSIRIRPYITVGSKTIYGGWVNTYYYTAPVSVSSLTPTDRTTSSLSVKWSKVASVSGYEVQIYRGGKWVSNTLSGNSTTSYAFKTGLSAGTSYNIRIRPYITVNGKKIYGAYKTLSYATKA